MREILSCASVLAILVVVAAPAPGSAEETATVRGSIHFNGTVPPPRRVLITKNNEICGDGEREIVEVDVEDGLLRDAVAFIDGKISGMAPPEAAEYELIQRDCRFRPYIMYVPKGATLKIVNEDPVAHNIHSYEIIGRARRDVFNFQQPTQGHTRHQKIKPRRGNTIQLTCDIHDFMTGWILVPENPFATVAGDGTFVIEGVPAGEHTLKVYHPILGVLEKKLTLTAGQQVTVDFEFESAAK